jgi:hypothetical protein
VGGGLVRDLPDAVNPEQIVKVDPFMGLAGGRVEAELYGGSIAHLRHRYDSADHVAQTFTQPAISQSLLKHFAHDALMQGSVGVDEEHPCVLVERFL